MKELKDAITEALNPLSLASLGIPVKIYGTTKTIYLDGKDKYIDAIIKKLCECYKVIFTAFSDPCSSDFVKVQNIEKLNDGLQQEIKNDINGNFKLFVMKVRNDGYSLNEYSKYNIAQFTGTQNNTPTTWVLAVDDKRGKKKKVFVYGTYDYHRRYEKLGSFEIEVK